MTLRSIRADLHIHTCLSPCGELEMTPMHIVVRCQALGIDVIAVCDHNSAENVMGVQRAAKGTSLKVLAGMEVTTSEEVHVVGIFDTVEQALTLQGRVYGHLLPGKNDEDLFGLQVVANERNEVEGIVERLLIGGTTLSLDAVLHAIHALGGLAVASHIDRDAYSLLGQLGMVPPDLEADALEVSWRGDEEAVRRVPGVDRFPLIRTSDAHRLDEIGRATMVAHLAEATTDELRMAFHGHDCRSIQYGGAVC